MSFEYPEPAQTGRLQWNNKHRPSARLPASPRMTAWIGRPDENSNLLYEGDNLDAVADLAHRGMLGQFHLVYLDPPFCSGRSYKKTIRLHGETSKSRPIKITQYEDSWDEDQYLQFCFERFLAAKALLHEAGSFILHVDEHMSHMLRCVLDEVFGRNNFINEIVWHYPDNFQGNVKGLANNHNLLFWYKKSNSFKSNPIRIPLEKPKKRDRRVWDKRLKKVVAARDENGNILYDMYTDRKADDVWRIGQSSVTKTRSHEYTGYPTQKPEELLSRIIEATTDHGDWVFDGFSGSGTTAMAAQKLGRRWAASDMNRVSIQTLSNRLQLYFERDLPNPDENQIRIPARHICLKKSPHPTAGKATLNTRVVDGVAEITITGLTLENTDLPGPPISPNWIQTIDSIRVDAHHKGPPFCTSIAAIPRTGQLATLTHKIKIDSQSERFSVQVIDVYGREFFATQSWSSVGD